MTKITTQLSRAYLVEIISQSLHINERDSILWGLVEFDNRGWLKRGDYVCTSRVVERINDTLFRTCNSLYELNAAPEKIRLPITSLLALRKGIDPAELQMLQEIQSLNQERAND